LPPGRSGWQHGEVEYALVRVNIARLREPLDGPRLAEDRVLHLWDFGTLRRAGDLAMGEALTIEVRRERDHAIVAAAGEIDIATVAELRERLFELADSGQSIVVDLSQVNFVDSTGLGALVGAAKRAAAHGATLHVVGARPQIRQLFRVTGLEGQVPLARTLDEALKPRRREDPAAKGGA
jgi:anti-sigma B factor antagonist